MDADLFAMTTGAAIASDRQRFIGETVDVIASLAAAVILIETSWRLLGMSMVEQPLLSILIFAAAGAVGFLFPAYVAAITNGRTPGKLIAGTRIVRTNGESVDLAFAIKREIYFKRIRFDGIAGIRKRQDWAASKVDPLGQSDHDKAAGTLVVKA